MFTQNRLNYSITQHSTTTPDGYILTIFNVKLSPSTLAKRNMTIKKNPFLYMHGMGSSADDLFMNGEGGSIGFYLVNNGFDVWLGNFRGNKYSHSHVNPKISDKDFFDFSWQEMGEMDLPTIYGYVLGETGAGKLVYAGYSQGTTAMFAAMSDSATSGYVQDRTVKMFMFAPVVFLTNVGAELLAFAAKFKSLVAEAVTLVGLYEIAPSDCSESDIWKKLLEGVCDLDATICEVVPGWGGTQVNPVTDTFFDKKATILAHVPAGTTLRVIEHYAQLVALNEKKYGPRFQKFDFGFFENIRRYGQFTAPFYDLNLIGDIDIVFMSGEKDKLGNEADVSSLVAAIQNGKNPLYIHKGYDHLTFAMMKDPEVVFAQLDSELKDIN